MGKQIIRNDIFWKNVEKRSRYLELPMSEVARRAGTNPGSILQSKALKIYNIRTSFVILIAQALGCTCEDLFYNPQQSKFNEKSTLPQRLPSDPIEALRILLPSLSVVQLKALRSYVLAFYGLEQKDVKTLKRESNG